MSDEELSGGGSSSEEDRRTRRLDKISERHLSEVKSDDEVGITKLWCTV